jgi:Tol biopolymer transport system component
MRPARPTAWLLLAATLAAAAPAAAHHRQTPAILALTTSGDTPLPRVPAQGKKSLSLAVQSGPNKQILGISVFKSPDIPTVVAATGDNANPAISFTGTSFAWDTSDDPLDLGLPGRQVVLSLNGALLPVSQDPTGTSQNPSLDTVGLRVAFESEGDLANTGNPPGTRQVFLRNSDGSIVQMSRGDGTAQNAVVSAKRRLIAFESTTDPSDDSDSGISQIWLGSIMGSASPTPITNGLGDSRNASLGDDGRLVVFESTADLAGAGVDTGIPQIFSYDTKTATYARITNDAGGCTLPAVSKVKRDWRITFVCSGEPFFYMLREDQRYRVQTDAGTTQRVIGELGIHFVALSTTANLLGAGTTAGKQVYLVNFFKRPPQAVATVPAVWFPYRGINPL